MIRILVDFNSNLHSRCIHFRKPIDEAILYSKRNNVAINPMVADIYDQDEKKLLVRRTNMYDDKTYVKYL